MGLCSGGLKPKQAASATKGEETKPGRERPTGDVEELGRLKLRVARDKPISARLKAEKAKPERARLCKGSGESASPKSAVG